MGDFILLEGMVVEFYGVVLLAEGSLESNRLGGEGVRERALDGGVARVGLKDHHLMFGTVCNLIQPIVERKHAVERGVGPRSVRAHMRVELWGPSAAVGRKTLERQRWRRFLETLTKDHLTVIAAVDLVDHFLDTRAREEAGHRAKHLLGLHLDARLLGASARLGAQHRQEDAELQECPRQFVHCFRSLCCRHSVRSPAKVPPQSTPTTRKEPSTVPPTRHPAEEPAADHAYGKPERGFAVNGFVEGFCRGIGAS